eukprot:Sspe_Gene.93769::Locus_66292_Transcript_1_1_Confidence_1.000_Length_558::g.93769::m.93769/K10583/UBE2S, E2EPF; ubiquitin-conjugating enzyme E2 S
MAILPTVAKSIASNINDLMKNPIEGIVVKASEDLLVLDAEIKGPDDTPFSGGSFNVRLCMDSGYPDVPPKGYFLTKIFHPNISDPRGEICVNTLKKDWNPSLGLRHILLVIRCLLIEPNPESALNEEAGKLLLEDYNEYCRRARIYTSIHATPQNQLGKENLNA